MLVEKRLGLEEANRVIEAVIAAAQERGSQVAVVIVDQHGDFIAGCRMDGRPVPLHEGRVAKGLQRRRL